MVGCWDPAHGLESEEDGMGAVAQEREGGGAGCEEMEEESAEELDRRRVGAGSRDSEEHDEWETGS